MQKKFRYVKGLTHAAHKFRYQTKPKPVCYKFNYTHGTCHGIYKFTYGEKEKPIYIEDSIKQYTYWGRKIVVEECLIKFPFITRHIHLAPIVTLSKEAIKHIEEAIIFNFETENREMYKEVPLVDMNKWTSELNTIEESVLLQKLKDKLCKVEDIMMYEYQEKYLTIVEIDHLLEVLRVLQVAISKNIVLIESKEKESILLKPIELATQSKLINTAAHFEFAKTTVNITTLKGKELAINKVNTMAYDALYLLGRKDKQEVDSLSIGLSMLYRIDKFELDMSYLLSVLERGRHYDLITVGDATLLESTQIPELTRNECEVFGTLQKVNEEFVTYDSISIYARKYLESCLLKAIFLKRRKGESDILENTKLLERNIYKEMLQEVSTKLKRVMEKDMLMELCNRLLEIETIREALKVSLQQQGDKVCNKEIANANQEKHLEAFIVKELHSLIHEKRLTLSSDKELLQNEVVQQLVKLQNKVRFLQVEQQEQRLEDITKYPLLIEEVSEALENSFRDIGVEELEHFVQKTFKPIALEDVQNKTDRTAKILQQEEYINLSKELLIQLEESEHTLKLYKRFWTVANSDFKDLMILPDHDYEYADEPIIEEDELMPDNYHVVYPNKFYKRIDRHPIPNGSELALDEIGVSINILIDLVNIFIMMWFKFTPAFWGWTGTQAVIGIVDSIYQFLTLETSRDQQLQNDVKEQYDRAYKWLRWEGEKMSLLARHDMELRGNYYVGLMLEELIYYMVDHHFEVVPFFEDINKMDEWRNMFERDVNRDIKFVLNKVKGIRHKLLEKGGNIR